MDAKMLKRKNAHYSPANDIEEDEDVYSTDEMDDCSDIEYATTTTSGNKLKRLKSYTNIDDLFHNDASQTSLMSNDMAKAAVKRMPTRRPDPKISNRNAIMARENRRKKKQHLESLQRSVDQTHSENKKLKKMLRTQDDKITRLTQESLYLRSILANKTEIMSLLRTIQGNRTPITSSTLSFVTDTKYQDDAKSLQRNSFSGRSSGCSPASSLSVSGEEDDKENGTVSTANAIMNFDPFLSANIEQNNFISTDLDSAGRLPIDSHSTTSYDHTADDFQWENLLNEPTFKSGMDTIPDLRDFDDNEILSTNSSNTVNIEHNYFNNPITNKVAEKTDNSPGICLHVSSGRVSLEFCATCHMNSQNAWYEEM